MIYEYTIIQKYISDTNMQTQCGKYFSLSEAGQEWKIIKSTPEYDKYIIYKPQSRDILAILYKGAISHELCQLAVNKYSKAGQVISTNRGNAAGSAHRNIKNGTSRYEKSAESKSNIIGYIDSPNHKRPCRLTSFSRDYYDDYKEGLAFIKAIDKSFQNCLPNNHKNQLEMCNKNPAFQIEDTSFSTVTVNYNFQTALHKDSGDYKEGFGNLVVCQDGILGGEILFPQYKLAISIETGDFLAMDVHEWHCNNTITYLNPSAYRLAFVCYYREKIQNCNEINKNLLALTGNLSGKSWDTEIIFKKIFEAININTLPNKILIQPDKPWWTMSAGRFKLVYKFKRYVLYDLETNEIIHNLIPAFNYVNSMIN